LSSATHAMDQRQDVLRQQRAAHEPVKELETFAQELHRLFVAAEREALGRALARFDLDVPALDVAGERDHRVLRCATTSPRAAGPVRVARSLSRQGHGDGRAVCPLAWRAGILEGAGPPWAAQQATGVVAPLTPPEGEALCALLGHRTPSKSTLDRLPKPRSVHWEAPRPPFAARLRPEEAIPDEAVTLAGSLDGGMAPMKDGQRQAPRPHARATGQAPRGPAGYQAVGWATVSSADGHGARLGTRRMARRPEPKKATLKSQLTAEVMGALRQRPDWRVMQGAEGAPDNWSYVGETLPFGAEGLDGSHAAEHLGAALGAAYGEGTPTSQERVET
jgi:hypothetical protein